MSVCANRSDDPGFFTACAADGRGCCPCGDEVRMEIDAVEALQRVLVLLEEWDRLTKGESPTTRRIREAITGTTTSEASA